jgi:soluble lytic murein transglycosylase-like protein
VSLVDMLLEQGSSPQSRMAMMEQLSGMGGQNLGPYKASVSASGDSTHWEDVASRIAQNQYGYSPQDFNALDSIIERESSWNPNAVNDSSGAAGIAQRISGYGKGYEADRPKQQIRWLLNYIRDRYGTPQDALAFKDEQGWY